MLEIVTDGSILEILSFAFFVIKDEEQIHMSMRVVVLGLITLD